MSSVGVGGADSAGGDTIVRWLTEARHEIAHHADELCALDAALGDGDHGTNMRRGFDAVGAAVSAPEAEAAPGAVLTLAGKTLLSTIGGASGALWGLALRRAGRALGDTPRVTPGQLADGVDAMVDAVVELGGASIGDKTMLDALAPAAAALRSAIERGDSLADAAGAAARAARSGAEATVQMEARKGRASFMGARSIGYADPSATSTAIVFTCLERALVIP